MSKIEIHSIQFVDDGAIVQFMLQTDVRVGGALVLTRALQVSSQHPDYADDLAGLQARVERIVTNALEDFESSLPHSPVPDEDDDELDLGMGE